MSFPSHLKRMDPNFEKHSILKQMKTNPLLNIAQGTTKEEALNNYTTIVMRKRPIEAQTHHQQIFRKAKSQEIKVKLMTNLIDSKEKYPFSP